MQSLSPHVRDKLCEALATLLEDNPTCDRLLNFDRYLAVLQLYENEIPKKLFIELHQIHTHFSQWLKEREASVLPDSVSANREAELTEKLLSIYIEVRGGGLIF